MALPFTTKVQVLVFCPALEHAPDQMAERPLLALKVIELLLAKLADWLLPTATLIPAGLDVTRSPARPLALTLKVARPATGLSVSAAVRVTPANAAEIVAEVDAATGLVLTVKLALVAPAGTLITAGRLIAFELLASETAAPPLGAAALSVTVPVAALPPIRLAGLSDNADNNAAPAAEGVTVNSACRPVPARSEKMLTEKVSATVAVEIGKLAPVAPAGTVTLAGSTATPGNGVDSATTAPPLGAARLSVTVPVAEPPPLTLLGLTDTPESNGGWPAASTIKTALNV